MTVVCDLKELASFAKKFVEQHPKGGVFALEGDLGAGKTTFVRQVMTVLAQQKNEKLPRIVSPTFVLHQSYQLGGRTIEHFDLYRLSDVTAESAMEIGLLEAVQQSENGFVFVEWPSKLTSDSGVKFDRTLKFEILPDESRRIS